MTEHTRRVFLGAAAAAATLSTSGVASGDSTEEQQDGDNDPVRARPSVWIEEAPLTISGYPFPEATGEAGEVGLHTYGQEVVLNVSIDDEQRHFESATEFTPEQAERVAALLQEFAEKARNDEEWVYP